MRLRDKVRVCKETVSQYAGEIGEIVEIIPNYKGYGFAAYWVAFPNADRPLLYRASELENIYER